MDVTRSCLDNSLRKNKQKRRKTVIHWVYMLGQPLEPFLLFVISFTHCYSEWLFTFLPQSSFTLLYFCWTRPYTTHLQLHPHRHSLVVWQATFQKPSILSRWNTPSLRLLAVNLSLALALPCHNKIIPISQAAVWGYVWPSYLPNNVQNSCQKTP